MSLARRKTHEEYVRDLQSKGIKAEPLETYVNSRTRLKHRWSCGHVTEVRPDSVLKGNGCGTCLGKQLKTHEWYVRELKERGIKVKLPTIIGGIAIILPVVVLPIYAFIE